MRALGIALLASLASCDGCTERTPNVCCTSDPECARLGLPPGSVADYSCGEGHVCRDFYCVPEESPDAPVDAPIDAPSGRCNPNAPFSAPTKLANVNTPFDDLSIALTPDELKAYFVHSSQIGYVIATASRGTIASDFPVPTTDPALAAIAAPQGTELYLYPTPDDLGLYYRRDTTWFFSSRPTRNDSFSNEMQVYVNGMALPGNRASISTSSVTLYWSSSSLPLRAATKGSASHLFANDRAATLFDLTDFAISADELTLYYSYYPNPDIYRTTRSSRNVPFDVGLPVPNVNTTGADVPLYVSPDDCALYLRAPSSSSSQEGDTWVTLRAQ